MGSEGSTSKSKTYNRIISVVTGGEAIFNPPSPPKSPFLAVFHVGSISILAEYYGRGVGYRPDGREEILQHGSPVTEVRMILER